MSSVIINNIDFDILKVNIEQSNNTINYLSNSIYVPNQREREIEIITETSINNLSLLESWVLNSQGPVSYFKKDSTICNLNGQNVKFIGLMPRSYNINFQSNSNSNNIEVIFNCDYFYTSISIREIRKEKLKKLNELANSSKK